MAETPITPFDITQIGDLWFHKVIETAHEGIGIIDPQGRLVYVNPHLLELVGYSLDEILGRKFYEFHVNPAEVSQQRLSERKTGKRESYEVQLRRKDGSLIWVLMNANPLMNEPAGRWSLHWEWCSTSAIAGRRSARAAKAKSDSGSPWRARPT